MWSLLKRSAFAVLWTLLVGCQGSPAQSEDDPFDGDECAAGTHNCADGYGCESTSDGFLCTDIDECALGESDCGEGFLCENTPGSYECADVDECATGDFSCGTGFTCLNNPGGYECVDADECADGIDTCDPLAGFCTNLEGGYQCDCIEGWYLDDDDETCIFELVLGSLIASAQNGPWESPSTWAENQVPGEGDWVTIGHDVSIAADANVDVGHSPPANDDVPAILILPSGSLSLGARSTLINRGDFITAGDVTLTAGSILQLDAGHALDRFTSVYILEITPGDGDAHLQINGTAGQRASVRSNEQAAHARITDGGVLGGGRIVAQHCDLVGLGGFPDYRAWSYSPAGDGAPYRIRDCTFDWSSQVKTDALIPAGGNVEFTRVRWTNSVVKPVEEQEPLEEWGIFQTGAQPGATVQVVSCDFDAIASLFFYEGYAFENNVFRSGVRGFSHWAGEWNSFRHNFVRWNSDDVAEWGLPGGIAVEDSAFVVDPSGCGEPDQPAICWNPHFIHMRADGGSEIIGNIWWWTGTDEVGEGDGIILTGAESGTRANNWYLFEKNIYLPNGNGSESEHNLSATPFTILESTGNFQVIFQRNTVFSGNSYGGCSIGEGGVTFAYDIGYFKSNLFVGSTDNKGFKMYNFGHAEPDAVVAEDANYNASYRLNAGTNYGPGAGKGYFELDFDEAGLIGANDLDDVNPNFVDPSRTPATWDAALGGAGTIEGAMDRLSPGGGSSMAAMLQYIREGFRPQNAVLRGAGDPDGVPESSPDIGAVDMSP